ncbi:MAG: hypothetical protein COU33_04360 [Candidatus Magasanikbacteria bacterium CG10_big_fil_rev_8_21_14_0_10_43_6]|uniref:DUF2231 domain-containing protein n=1 Tax=Candidatus Magasanikbacteria bacterium CG10_big_fil_rev_8_21_14_0_10_43_6 TaxID=1974650 RepID=A0A2M6W093_9BACT|nr:MAG: hypothetical protein COU33_04360 [Candidatus Magasanikbacteria bacterium CG10_big_fil_rev_8_21_14_0_10_43_6]
MRTYVFLHTTMGELHPAIVHIPIGILALYTLAECLRWGAFFHSAHWQKSKAFMIIVGVVGSFGAFLSGSALEEIYGHSLLLSRHELFATVTIYIYSLLASAYLIWVIDISVLSTPLKKKPFAPVWHPLTIASGFVRTPIVVISSALLGFLSLTITGALGGALVRGPEADFLVSVIYSLFVQ